MKANACLQQVLTAIFWQLGRSYSRLQRSSHNRFISHADWQPPHRLSTTETYTTTGNYNYILLVYSRALLKQT